MKKLSTVIGIVLCFVLSTNAQTATTFVVQGDLDKFYPVTFTDANWWNHKPTIIEIGRSNIHQDATMRGSVISTFSYHLTRWGNLSHYINAEIYESADMIGGWTDATASNADYLIVVWLKGGSTTYSLSSQATISATVYDGVANTLPFTETNGASHSYKTVRDTYAFPNSKIIGDNLVVGNQITALGSVGIGTFNPLAKLHVNGVLRWGDAGAYVYGGEDGGGGYLEHIGTNAPTSTMRFQTVKPGTGQYSVFSSNPYNGFSFTTYNGGNANVGIGTKTPGAPLHVTGGLPMTGGWNQTSILEATFPVQVFNSNNSKYAGIGYDYGEAMSFWVNGSSADVSGTAIRAMSIANTGNIAVGPTGPTNPAYKFTVFGKIHAKEIRVDANGLPDYVFEDNYKLPTLSETEAFIKKNKHLPEIPSAAEAEKNGMELGEMNKILLKKIEELTLHLIEKDKQVNATRAQLIDQNERIAKLEKLIKTLVDKK